MKIETLAVHGGYSPDPTTKAVAVPIYQTTSYAFDSTQHGADLFDLKVAGNIYTRIMNPTQDVLEKRVAAMEGGIAALCMASGMAAITAAIQTIAEAGDNIVTSSTLYGGTYNLFAHTLPQYGIDIIPARPSARAAAPACYDCGTIEAVREISTPAEGSGLGAIAGGVLGGLLGNQVGQGKGSQVAAVVGALGGAYAGHQAEKHFRAEKQLEVTVRLDDGSTRTALLSGPSRWRAGDRVRLSNGNLLPV